MRTTKSGKKGSLNARSAAAAAAAKKNKPTTFGGRVYRALFGWLETKVKVGLAKRLREGVMGRAGGPDARRAGGWAPGGTAGPMDGTGGAANSAHFEAS